MRTLAWAFLGSLTWHVIFFFGIPCRWLGLPELELKTPKITYVGNVVESKKKIAIVIGPKFKTRVWEKIFQPVKPSINIPESKTPPWGLEAFNTRILLPIATPDIEKKIKVDEFVFLGRGLPKLSKAKMKFVPPYFHPVMVRIKELRGELSVDFKKWLELKKILVYSPRVITVEF